MGVRMDTLQDGNYSHLKLLLTCFSSSLFPPVQALHPAKHRGARVSQSPQRGRRISCLSGFSQAGRPWGQLSSSVRGRKGLTIGTRVAGTPVYFLLTVGAGEAGGAFAGVTGPLVALPAGAPIEAGRVCTGQGTMFTVLAIVAWGAQAVIAILLVLERGHTEAEVRPRGVGLAATLCLSRVSSHGHITKDCQMLPG